MRGVDVRRDVSSFQVDKVVIESQAEIELDPNSDLDQDSLDDDVFVVSSETGVLCDVTHASPPPGLHHRPARLVIHGAGRARVVGLHPGHHLRPPDRGADRLRVLPARILQPEAPGDGGEAEELQGAGALRGGRGTKRKTRDISVISSAKAERIVERRGGVPLPRIEGGGLDHWCEEVGRHRLFDSPHIPVKKGNELRIRLTVNVVD